MRLVAPDFSSLLSATISPHFLSNPSPQDHTIFSHSLAFSIFLSMALQPFSPIPQLIQSNGRTVAPPPSIFASNDGRLFVDFVGLYCKSKRTRRKFGASSGARSFTHFAAKTSSAVKAVLDTRRCSNALDDEPRSPTDCRRQVRF